MDLTFCGGVEVAGGGGGEETEINKFIKILDDNNWTDRE